MKRCSREFSILLELPSLGLFHEAWIEPQLDVVLVSLHAAIRITDPDNIHVARVFAEESMLEAEVPHEIHFLFDLSTMRICKRRLCGPEHRCSAELPLVLVKRTVRTLSHLRQHLVRLWATLRHQAHHLIPRPNEGLTKA